MNKTIFKITQMDCPSEEHLIRMKLSVLHQIQSLDFDIANRRLTIWHEGSYEPILKQLEQLKLGSNLLSTVQSESTINPFSEKQQKKLLLQVLFLNFAFFVFELTFGLVANSLGLVADSLDMLADSIVYFLALLAVGGSILYKQKIAQTAGYIQIILALVGLVEVIRRFFHRDYHPEFELMIMTSLAALAANILCLYLLQKSKSQDAHMRASMIFTSNDVIVNAGVILAALAVYYTHSALPDLVIGLFVFLFVARGALNILKLAR